MNTAAGIQIRILALGVMALLLSGCADMPAWVPFQGARSDDLPGVVTPAAKIAQLKTLSSEAGKADQENKHRVVGQLITAIRSETDSLIRAEIIRTLGDYPDPAADPVLKAALNDPDADVRVIVCRIYGKRGDAEAVKLLAEVLKSDTDRDVRMAAARALGSSHDPSAIAALGAALEDTDPAMQYRAVASLRQVTHQDLGNDVEKWRAYVKNSANAPAENRTLVGRVFGGIK
jgi:HEAT repeat protein